MSSQSSWNMQTADREWPSAAARVNRVSSFLFSSAQPRHRLDANAKKERLDGFIAHSHLPLTQCIKPPMTAFCQQ
jgi:hypothetical protein